jgi:hypothetical protein
MERSDDTLGGLEISSFMKTENNSLARGELLSHTPDSTPINLKCDHDYSEIIKCIEMESS